MLFKVSIYNPKSLPKNINRYRDDKVILESHNYKENLSLLNEVVNVNITENGSDKFKYIVTTFNHSPHIFKSGYRKSGNFIETSGLILDFDNKNDHRDSSIQEFINSDFAKTFAYILYTSKSHVPDVQRDSFHVFVPLNAPIKDTKVYQELLYLVGFYLKQQDDLKTDKAILADKGNRFIYPSRQNNKACNFADFKMKVNIFQTLKNGDLKLNEGTPVVKNLLSLGYFLDKPEFMQALELYHQKASDLLNNRIQVEHLPLDVSNNKIDKLVQEGADFVHNNGKLFTHNEWWKLGQALFNHYGVYSKEIFLSMLSDDKFTEEAFDVWEKYKVSEESPVLSIRSFLYIIKEKGYNFSYDLKKIQLNITTLDIHRDIFFQALLDSMATEEKLFFITKAKAPKTFIMNRLDYHIDSKYHDNFGKLTALTFDEEGIKVTKNIAELKLNNFIDMIDHLRKLSMNDRNIFDNYNITFKNKIVGNTLFTSLEQKLMLYQSGSGDFNLKRISGLYLADGTKVNKAFKQEINNINEVIEVNINNGDIIYHNPVIDYPKDLLELKKISPLRFTNEVKKRSLEFEAMLLELLEKDETAFQFFLDFLAQYTYEYRVNANKCTVVLTGVRGSGKNTIAENIIGSIFKTNEVIKRDKKIDNTQFTNLFSRKLALFDETEMNNYELEDLLKAMSGATTIKVRELYENSRQHLIYAYGFVLSNSRSVINITDRINDVRNNQFYVKHLSTPLVRKLPKTIVDNLYIKQNLRCFIEYTLKNRYQENLGKFRGYRYGIPVPITDELTKSFKGKTKNTYHNIAVKLRNVEDFLLDMVSEDKVRLDDISYKQLVILPHLWLLVNKKVLTSSLAYKIMSNERVSASVFENTLRSLNTEADYEVTTKRVTIGKRQYRGYSINHTIIQHILTEYAQKMLLQVASKDIIKTLDSHLIFTTKIDF